MQGSLRDDALEKIIDLPIRGENYMKAWNILVKAYENKRLIISKHISLILIAPRQDKNDRKSLEKLADIAMTNLNSLETLGVKLAHEIVVHILDRKLLPLTLMDWKNSLERNVFPSLDSMIEFLYKRAALQSLPSNDKNNYDSYCPPNKKQKLDKKQTAKSYVTTSKTCTGTRISYLIQVR